MNSTKKLACDNAYCIIGLPIAGLRHCIYSGDEITIITTAPPTVTEIIQNHKDIMSNGEQIPAWRLLSLSRDCHLLIICLPSNNTEVL